METTEKIQRLPFFPAQANVFISSGSGIYPEFLKRIIDIFLAVLFLPLVLPLLILLILLIKIDSRGPAIFRSERIGRDGKRFNCLKLRTMCLNAEEKLMRLLDKDPALRQEWEKDHKLKKDPRITRVGKIIRSISLDELPQFFNVLKGEMSFVGPRPIVDTEIHKYGENFKYYKRLRPGITGMWQTNGRNDTSYDNRVLMDKLYSKNPNLLLDLVILFKTIPVALSQKGAY